MQPAVATTGRIWAGVGVKLKVTVERTHGRPNTDLLISVDPATPVGALADYLALSDPDATADHSGTYTLAFSGAPPREIRRESSIADAGVHSGGTVALVRQLADAPEPVQAAAAAIFVVSGPDAGKEFSLPVGTSVIGRGRDCEVRLSDPMTSRRHAKIHVGEAVEISDLGSVNGVLIGDASVESAILRPGESARLGDTVISARSKGGADHTGGTGSRVSFNRPPQILTTYEGRTFSLPDPPTSQRGQRFPIIPLFAPLLMGAALYLTTRSPTSLIFMAMSPVMMGGNVLEGQLAGKRNYLRDLDKFRAAIASRRAELIEATAAEVRSRCAEHPSVHECSIGVRTYSAILWSRRPDLPGFGALETRSRSAAVEVEGRVPVRPPG